MTRRKLSRAQPPWTSTATKERSAAHTRGAGLVERPPPGGVRPGADTERVAVLDRRGVHPTQTLLSYRVTFEAR